MSRRDCSTEEDSNLFREQRALDTIEADDVVDKPHWQRTFYSLCWAAQSKINFVECTSVHFNADFASINKRWSQNDQINLHLSYNHVYSNLFGETRSFKIYKQQSLSSGRSLNMCRRICITIFSPNWALWFRHSFFMKSGCLHKELIWNVCTKNEVQCLRCMHT